MTVIASFVMFRIDLCVSSLFIVTIVVIRMLILDVCVSKQNSLSEFSNLFTLLLDLKLKKLQSPMLKHNLTHIVKDLDSE